MRTLHMKPVSATFIFTEKAAVLNVTRLWNSGAAKTLVNAKFSRRHNVRVTHWSEPVALTNGHKTIIGVAKLPNSIQQYRATIFFKVVDIAERIDIIFGTNWSCKTIAYWQIMPETDQNQLCSFAKEKQAEFFPIGNRPSVFLFWLI